jgi:hypothetical protein
LFLAFGLMGLYLYLLDRHASSGFMMGLSFLSKQPAILFLFGIIALELLKPSRKIRGIMICIAAFSLAVLPYLTYNLYADSRGFFGGQSGRVLIPLTEQGSQSRLWLSMNEIFWGLSPPMSVFFVFAIIHIILKRSRKELLPVVFSAIFLLFFSVYNKHGYYILPLAPFSALACSRLLKSISSNRIRALILAFLLISAGFHSILMLCSNKYGFEHFKRMPEIYAQDENPVIVVGDTISQNNIKGLKYYNPQAEIVMLTREKKDSDGMVELDYSRPTYLLMIGVEIDPSQASPRVIDRFNKASMYSDIYSPVLFGVVFYQPPLNPHFFKSGSLTVQHVLEPTTFGILRIAQTRQLYLVKLEPKERVYFSDGAFSIGMVSA